MDGRTFEARPVEPLPASRTTTSADVFVIQDEEKPKRVVAPRQEHATVAKVQSAVANAEAAVAVVEAEAARQAGARAKRGARRSRRPASTESAGDEEPASADEEVRKPSPFGARTGFRLGELRGLEGMPRDMSISPISEPGVGRKRKRRKPRESSEDNAEEKGHAAHGAKRKKVKKVEKPDKPDKPERNEKAEKADRAERADERKGEDKRAKKKKRHGSETRTKADHPQHRSASPHRSRGGAATEGKRSRADK